MTDTGFTHTADKAWRDRTEQDLLGIPAVTNEDVQGPVLPAAGMLLPNKAASAGFKLVDLVKPGPSGTVASTAAAATAGHAAAIKAAPNMGPGGLAITMSAAQTGTGTAMQDLLQAAQKALASGLGDWHLQVLQDISPQFQEHVLMGALGPETLKHKHKLPEEQILQVYGLLHRHSTGFQQEVQQALAGAAHVEQLLASIWTAFAQLWDESVQLTFQGEVLAAMQELQDTYTALLDAQDALAATQQENTALKERCDEFVKANLDHMLSWRSLKAKADALEGEVTMLSSANNEISLRAAANQARNTQLTVQLEGAGARLAQAEKQLEEREAALSAARIALVEKDSGLCRLEAQVAALEQQLLAAGHAANKQTAAHGDLQRQLDAKEHLVKDAERRVADKQRAYNLLHADFVKQKAEAAEATQRTAEVEQQLANLQQQLENNKGFVAKADNWRKRWEICQMEVEDLQTANIRATMRRQELVNSYWPVMERLNAAEDAVAALSQQVKQLGQEPAAALGPRDTRAAEVTAMRGPAAAAGTNPASPFTSIEFTQTTCMSEAPAKHSRPLGNEAAETDPVVGSSSLADAALVVAEHGGTEQATAAVEQQPEQGSVKASMESTLKQELQQLQESYLILQDEYWRQKAKLMALEIEAGELRVENEQVQAAAAQAAANLDKSRHEAAEFEHRCITLEADIVGYKSWVRELEKTEQAYLKAIREQGALEDAATAAERQLSDCRLALAAAESNCMLAQAAAEAVAKECKQLMSQLAQEMNKSTLFEEELQKVHKQQMSNSRAAQTRLREQLDQQRADLATSQSQLADAQQQHSIAVQQAEKLRAELQHAKQHNNQMSEQLRQARSFLAETLQKLEQLESKVSYINSTSISSIDTNNISSNAAGSQTVEVAVESAVHLMERLLVTLQCLAADAATISNAATAAKVEVLIKQLMEGLESSAAAVACDDAGKSAKLQSGGTGARAAGANAIVTTPAAPLVVLRNAAGNTNKQVVRELEQQVSVLHLQLSQSRSQLSEALSSCGRLQRALQLKSRAVGSLEQQLAAAKSQMQPLQSSQIKHHETVLQLQNELAVAKLDLAQLQAAATTRAGELQAAVNRAAAAEAELQGQQAAAEEAAVACAQAIKQLSEAVAAARQDALAAATGASAASAAQQQTQELQVQLITAQERIAKLETNVAESRQKADIGIQAARDAEFRAVQTNTLLADARRELEFTQKMLETVQGPQASVDAAVVADQHAKQIGVCRDL